jgi:hypothetical protein
MTDREVQRLVSEIEEVDFREFWWDGPLLTRAASVHDQRVVRALALRHHGLSNKAAFSAHVVRQAVKQCDGPQLAVLWNCIDAETNSTAIIQRMEDFAYLPWAAAFIIGEVGGAFAFTQATKRLGPSHSARHYLIARLLSHVVVRYLGIEKESEPQTTFIDLKTGEQETLLSRYVARPQFDMARRKRTESNELFTRLTRTSIQEAKTGLTLLPDEVLNYPKPDFLHALDCIKT